MTRTTFSLWVAVGILLAMLATGPPAVAHTEAPGPPETYCGHYWKYWQVELPNGWYTYKEDQVWGWTVASGHFHVLNVWRWPTRLGEGAAAFVHKHDGRPCPRHAV